MNSNRDEAIQRYLDGQSSPEEATKLQEALIEDAELRALYLDYMNLDAALGAAADAATTLDYVPRKATAFPQESGRLSSNHSWRWMAFAAACIALMILVLLPGKPVPPKPQPEVATVIYSAQGAIARVSIELPPPIPAWASPTASLLDQPRLPE